MLMRFMFAAGRSTRLPASVLADGPSSDARALTTAAYRRKMSADSNNPARFFLRGTRHYTPEQRSKWATVVVVVVEARVLKSSSRAHQFFNDWRLVIFPLVFKT